MMPAATARPSRTKAFAVSIVTTVEQFDALEEDWRELIAHSAAGAEFLHDPAVIRVMLTDTSQGLSPAFVVVRHDDIVQCIAPFYVHRTTVPLRLSVIQLASFPARTLRLFGDRIIFREGHDPQEALVHLFEALRGMRHSFDLIWIYSQRIDDPLWRFLNSPAASRLSLRAVAASRPEKLHCLDFKRTFEEYLTEVRTKPGFPGKTIRRFWRDMKDRCEVRRISRPDEVAAFLDDVNRVYATTWQARTYGARVRNGQEEIARLEAIAALGYLRSYVLADEARAIAFVLGYQYPEPVPSMRRPGTTRRDRRRRRVRC